MTSLPAVWRSDQSRVWWMRIRSTFRVKCEPNLIFPFCRSPANPSRRRLVAQWKLFSGLVSTLWRDGVPNRGAVSWRWKMLFTSGSRSEARHRDFVTVGLVNRWEELCCRYVVVLCFPALKAALRLLQWYEPTALEA